MQLVVTNAPSWLLPPRLHPGRDWPQTVPLLWLPQPHLWTSHSCPGVLLTLQTEIFFINSENVESFPSVSEKLTGEGGYVPQFVFIDVGKQRLWGVILCDMAALAYKASSTLWHKSFVKAADFSVFFWRTIRSLPEQRCCSLRQGSSGSHPASTAHWKCWIVPGWRPVCYTKAGRGNKND